MSPPFIAAPMAMMIPAPTSAAICSIRGRPSALSALSTDAKRTVAAFGTTVALVPPG